MMSDLRISDKTRRKIKCIGNEDNMFCHNGHLLEIGKEYTLIDTEVYSWNTDVYIEEIPNKAFNSVWFAEVNDDSK